MIDFQEESIEITAGDSISETFIGEFNILLKTLPASKTKESGRYQLVRDFCRKHSMEETLIWFYLFIFDGKGATVEGLKNGPPSLFKVDSAELKAKQLDILCSETDPLINYHFSGMLKLRHVFMDRINFTFDKVLYDYLTGMTANSDWDALCKFSHTCFELLINALGDECYHLYDMIFTPPLEIICKEYQTHLSSSLSQEEEL